MMRNQAVSAGQTMLDYSNLSGVSPLLLDELDSGNIGNITTVSQHSNDSIERLAGGVGSQLSGSGHGSQQAHSHQKGHSRGSSAPLAYDRITTKIACTKEAIRKEQETRDANVNEYLKLAANADKQQLARIKAVFEKKNQKSANAISHLQKKLESYSKRYKDLQQTQQKQQQQQQAQQQQQQQQQAQQQQQQVQQQLAAVAAQQEANASNMHHSAQHSTAGSGSGGGGGGGSGQHHGSGSQTLPSNLQQHLATSTASGSGQSFLQPREMLRDVGKGLMNVGGNIRHGVTGLSTTVISKPRKFAHLFRNKFGSADNINQLTATWYTGSATTDPNDLSLMEPGIDQGQTTTPSTLQPHAAGHHHHHHHHSHHPTSISDSEGRRQGQAQTQATTHSGGQHRHGAHVGGGKYSEHDSECSSVTSDSMPPGSDKHHRLGGSSQQQQQRSGCCTHQKALAELRDEQQKLRERCERLELLPKDVSELSMALENERYRADRLEEQINDLSELHQNERENLKQAIADLEEKVQYQSDERLRDVNEILENCQTRIAKMEQLSQQQYVTVEGIYNSNARAVVVKLINVVLTVLQVILLLVATAAGIIVPFLKTRFRVLTTLLFLLALIVIVRQWPDVRDTGVHLIRTLRSQVIADAP
ncbi:transmembrane and coiled-coil domain protein 1 [Anopheles darlingi]|uniref:Transmembrane and coiled-coil domain protein 1 n=1 Tax=Anopheles darlingi TaxID=43151 RepID=W5JR29_ANODA|nr:transmembrane and coiled-coil domain protein 1 [Anopheles darlingi]